MVVMKFSENKVYKRSLASFADIITKSSICKSVMVHVHQFKISSEVCIKSNGLLLILNKSLACNMFMQ